MGSEHGAAAWWKLEDRVLFMGGRWIGLHRHKLRLEAARVCASGPGQRGRFEEAVKARWA